MKKVILLAPRVDIAWTGNKHQILVSDPNLAQQPIRQKWLKFVELASNEYKNRQDVDFECIQIELHRLPFQFLSQLKADVLLIPHRESHQYKLTNSIPYYYMQTQYTDLFSVDPKGWGGGASVYPFTNILSASFDDIVFNKLKEDIKNNISKFNQPPEKKMALPQDYVLFLLQIPHDDTIKYHSKTSVASALKTVVAATKELGIPLVVKGHPVRPDLMKTFELSLQDQKHVTWKMNFNIHQLITKARSVVTVNSGAGFEVLLHEKPVITFGKAEYDCVGNPCTRDNFKSVVQNATYNKEQVVNFFHHWYHWCYNIEQPDSFKKLP